MPSLVCSAITCVYNKGHFCSKGDINVGGEDAKTSRETCCESFRSRTENQATSAMGTPSQQIKVGCDACKCYYNEDHRCAAERIDIAGASACKCEQTACGTFRCGE